MGRTVHDISRAERAAEGQKNKGRGGVTQKQHRETLEMMREDGWPPPRLEVRRGKQRDWSAARADYSAQPRRAVAVAHSTGCDHCPPVPRRQVTRWKGSQAGKVHAHTKAWA